MGIRVSFDKPIRGNVQIVVLEEDVEGEQHGHDEGPRAGADGRRRDAADPARGIGEQSGWRRR